MDDSSGKAELSTLCQTDGCPELIEHADYSMRDVDIRDSYQNSYSCPVNTGHAHYVYYLSMR